MNLKTSKKIQNSKKPKSTSRNTKNSGKKQLLSLLIS
jgi:hypothetical protein